MAPRTRRHLLRTAVGAAAALAGCGRIGGSESSESRAVSEGGTTIPGGTTETDPPVLLIRADTDRPPVRVDESSGSGREGEGSLGRTSTRIIDSDAVARDLAVADGVDHDRVSSFGAATDLDAETLYLQTIRVEQCFRLRLCRISWTAEEVRATYVRMVRAYDERCSADTTVFETRLVRVPAALEADDVRSHGSSVRSGGQCGSAGPGGAEGASGAGGP